MGLEGGSANNRSYSGELERLSRRNAYYEKVKVALSAPTAAAPMFSQTSMTSQLGLTSSSALIQSSHIVATPVTIPAIFSLSDRDTNTFTDVYDINRWQLPNDADDDKTDSDAGDAPTRISEIHAWSEPLRQAGAAIQNGDLKALQLALGPNTRVPVAPKLVDNQAGKFFCLTYHAEERKKNYWQWVQARYSVAVENTLEITLFEFHKRAKLKQADALQQDELDKFVDILKGIKIANHCNLTAELLPNVHKSANDGLQARWEKRIHYIETLRAPVNLVELYYELSNQRLKFENQCLDFEIQQKRYASDLDTYVDSDLIWEKYTQDMLAYLQGKLGTNFNEQAARQKIKALRESAIPYEALNTKTSPESEDTLLENAIICYGTDPRPQVYFPIMEYLQRRGAKLTPGLGLDQYNLASLQQTTVGKVLMTHPILAVQLLKFADMPTPMREAFRNQDHDTAISVVLWTKYLKRLDNPQIAQERSLNALYLISMCQSELGNFSDDDLIKLNKAMQQSATHREILWISLDTVYDDKAGVAEQQFNVPKLAQQQGQIGGPRVTLFLSNAARAFSNTFSRRSAEDDERAGLLNDGNDGRKSTALKQMGYGTGGSGSIN